MVRYFLLIYCVFICFFSNCQWITLTSPSNQALHGVDFSSASNGAVCGMEGIYETNDGGLSWQEIVITTNDSIIYNGSNLYDIIYNDYNDSWFAVGFNQGSGQSVIFQKLSGNQWEVGHSANGDKLNSIFYVDQFICAVGDNGEMLKSNDGGTSWISIGTGVSDNFNGITASNDYFYISTNNSLYSQHKGNTVGISLYKPWGSVDLTYISGVNDIYGVQNTSIFNGFGNSWSYSSNFFLPFQPNCISDGFKIVGTEDGILIALGNLWEKFSSTVGYDINSIDRVDNSNHFAVSENGEVLWTNNLSNDRMPYFSINGVNGACVDSLFTLTAFGDLSYNWEWLVNGSSISTQSTLDTSFSTIGNHQIGLIATSSSGLSDTIFYNQSIVPLPDTSLITAYFPQNVICDSGEVFLEIQNTETDVIYTLSDLNSGVPVGSIQGNGGVINIYTGILYDSTEFAVSLKNIGADCEVYLLDTFIVKVQKPKADFRSTLINADIGEPCIIHEICEQTENYFWNFGLGGVPGSSVFSDPLVSYSLSGQSTIQLIAESEAGCRDTIVKNGPYILNPIVDNDEYSISMNEWGTQQWSNLQVNSMAGDDHGNITVLGAYNESVISSRYGVSDTTNDDGVYIAQYKTNGTLRWAIKLENAYLPYYGTGLDVVPETGEIFLQLEYDNGSQLNSAQFIFNDGRVTDLPNALTMFNTGVFKLDSLGHLEWIAYSSAGAPVDIGVDSSGVVHVAQFNSHSLSWPSIVEFNDANDSTIIDNPSTNLKRLSVFSLDEDGKWLSFNTLHVGTQFNDLNFRIDINEEGKMVMAGDFVGSDLQFPDGTSINATGVNYPAVICLDATGNFLWEAICPSLVEGNPQISIDKLGNTHLFCRSYGNIDAGNGSFGLNQDARYALVSFDSSGYLKGKSSFFSYDMSNHPFGFSMETDKIGNIYLAMRENSGFSGWLDSLYDNSFNILHDTLNTSFVLYKQDLNGNAHWLAHESPPQNQTTFNVMDIYVLDSVPFVVGSYATSSGTGIILGDTLPNTSQQDGAICRFLPTGGMQSDSIFYTNPVSTTYCPGDSAHIDFISQDFTPNSNNWYFLNAHDGTNLFVIDSIYSDDLSESFHSALSTLPPGQYNMWVEASSPQVLGNITPIQVLSSSLPAPIVQTDSVCTGLSVTLNANSGVEHTWSNSPSISQPYASSNTIFPVIFDEAIYVTISTYCGQVVDTFNVVAIPLPSIDVSGDMEVCEGDTTILTVTTDHYPIHLGINSSYHAINDSTFAAYPPTGFFGENYIFQAVDSINFCAFDTTIFVANNFPPQPTINYLSTQNELVLSNSNASYSYQWYQDGVMISGANSDTYTPTNNGAYFMEVTDTNGCVGISNTEIVTITSLPHISDNQVKIFPTPSSSEGFFVQFDHILEEFEIKLYSIDGKLLLAEKYAQENMVHVDDFVQSTGNILIHIISQKSHLILKHSIHN